MISTTSKTSEKYTRPHYGSGTSLEAWDTSIKKNQTKFPLPGAYILVDLMII